MNEVKKDYVIEMRKQWVSDFELVFAWLPIRINGRYVWLCNYLRRV